RRRSAPPVHRPAQGQDRGSDPEDKWEIPTPPTEPPAEDQESHGAHDGGEQPEKSEPSRPGAGTPHRATIHPPDGID
ncbi:MAG: hypothetical protein ABEJ71_01440, partial [Halodesulfurarchaeum sp.]